jgi:hypothetical protein
MTDNPKTPVPPRVEVAAVADVGASGVGGAADALTGDHSASDGASTPDSPAS